MKGMSDKVMTTIVALVLAVLALVVIWIFLSGTAPHITKAVQGFTCNMCKTVLPDAMEGSCGEC
ncbi:MAG: hypothetical protein A2Y81_11765 [Nitrospirae bacterium RBG_13_43_8]|nr:MAG: hypothetical protein A2Y81_11765 [Nitrospirae bacterium RBG_13_43_8]